MNKAMNQGHFYVCPTCFNHGYFLGEADISCCGVKLEPIVGELDTETKVEESDGFFYVHINKPMRKEDYVLFIAGVYPDGVDIKKCYPEGSAEATFKRSLLKEIYYYSTTKGLYKMPLLGKGRVEP